MAELLRVDLFCEDRAHREFLQPVVRRVALEAGLTTELDARSAGGGHPRAIAAFRAYQRVVLGAGTASADLVIVAIDTNCSSHAKQRQEISKAADAALRPRLVAACPNPHIERWYLADPEAFKAVIGRGPMLAREKCERGFYKRILAETVREAGHPALVSGLEFAAPIVERMDWYRAGKNDSSLKKFLDELRGGLRRAARQRGR